MAEPKLTIIYRCAGITRAKHGEERFSAAVKSRRLIGPNLRTALANGHVSCGYDMSPILAELPADGEDHVVTCPFCGAETTAMRTPEDDS